MSASRTFAPKPKATQHTASARSTIPGGAHLGQSHEVTSILRLQRTIANQALQRLPAPAGPDDLEVPSSTTEVTSLAHDFSQIPVPATSPARVQAKLKVGAPGDSYEQEADRIAEQAMATPADSAESVAPPRIQRFSGQSNGQMDAAPASVDRALASPGRPLEPTLRQDMEQRLGYDFSHVRVNSGATAEQSVRDVNAHAYTVGHNIMFSTGQFAPGSQEGRRLIAHELTHVVQQGGSAAALQRQPDDRKILSRDLKEISDELEKIRQQLGEGAEDLEIFRWRLALAGQKLPEAESRIDENTTASFVEAAIETSEILRPFLLGKLATTSVGKNFKIYDFRTQFEEKRKELSREKSVKPTIGQPAPTTLTGGFYHRRTDSIHLPPDAKFGQALHEGIHRYSSVAIQNALGVFINEGFTQSYTDDVLAEHSLGSISHAYGPNLKCAKIVLKWINNDKMALGRAYFQGDANPLLQAVMRKLGIKTAREHIQLTQDRGGLGLCERIEQVGP